MNLVLASSFLLDDLVEEYLGFFTKPVHLGLSV